MLRAERLEKIVEIVNREKIATLEQIMGELEISIATVRRDINELAHTGAIQKTRGGAMSVSHASAEPSFVAKKASHTEEKIRLAAAAREYISPGDRVILDSGTTIIELAKIIDHIPDLTIVTNDLFIAAEASAHPNVSVLMVGGMVRKGFNSTFGYFAENMLEHISVSKTFLSIDAVDMEQGLMSYTTDDINIKRQYMNMAGEVILLCDHSKFQAGAFIRISSLKHISRIIVGKELSPSIAEQIREAGISLNLV